LVGLFAAALGVNVDIEAAPFDSVEQLAVDPGSPLKLTPKHIVILSLSEYWLRRYLGTAALVDQDSIDHVKQVLESILSGLQAREPARILVTDFASSAYAAPGGTAALGARMGWNRAVTQLNHWLGDVAGPQAHVLALSEALFGAGGRAAVGRV